MTQIDNMSPQEMATAILHMQRRCTTGDNAYIKFVLHGLHLHHNPMPCVAFAMIENYVHTNDKQSFCRLFETLTGTSWTGFLEQMFEIVSFIPAQHPPRSVKKSAPDNLKVMLGEQGKRTGEFGRRLNYIVQCAKIERTDLANRAGIGRTTLYRYMLTPQDARFAVPKERNACSIMTVLPISTDEFCAYPNNFDAWKQQFKMRTMR